MVRDGRRIPSLSDCPFCLLLAVCLSVCWRDEWTHAPHRSFLLVPLGSPVRSWHLGFERLLSGSCKKTAPSLAENVTVACGVQCKVRGSQVVAEPSFSLSQFPTRPCYRRKTIYHPYPPPPFLSGGRLYLTPRLNQSPMSISLTVAFISWHLVRYLVPPFCTRYST